MPAHLRMNTRVMAHDRLVGIPGVGFLALDLATRALARLRRFGTGVRALSGPGNRRCALADVGARRRTLRAAFAARAACALPACALPAMFAPATCCTFAGVGARRRRHVTGDLDVDLLLEQPL